MTSADDATRAGTYLYDQSWQHERRRLDAMEELWDAGTKSVLEDLGLAAGWRCLEVGAGSGSIAAWLSDQVGESGEVLATDVDTSHLVALNRPGLEVRRHDILSDPLPAAHFDLVHARLVVEHIGERALERMMPTLRPGGWLVAESLDWKTMVHHPEDPATVEVVAALRGLMSGSGFDSQYGRKLVHALERAGLGEVRAEGRVRVYRGGTPAADFLKLSVESLSTKLIEVGGIDDRQLEAAVGTLEDPDTVFVTPPMIAAWGVKPPDA